MARVAMGDVWDEAKAFVAAESALLFPLAFATLGVATLLFDLSVPSAPAVPAAEAARAGRMIVPGPWMLVMVPVLLLILIGNLAVSALVLQRGGSVREALAGALRRLPGALLTTILGGAAMLAIMVAAGILATIVAMAVGGGEGMAARLLVMTAMPVLLWFGVRLLPTVPLLAESAPTLAAPTVLRRAFALTRGGAGPIAGAALLYLLGSLLVTLSLQFALGSVLEILGRAVGSPGLGETLTAIALTIASTILQTVWIVFQAVLYRRLAGRG